MLNELELNEVKINIATAQRMLIELQDAYPNTEVSKEAYDIQMVLARANGVISKHTGLDYGRTLSKRFQSTPRLQDTYPQKRRYF